MLKRYYGTCLAILLLVGACSTIPQPRNFDDTLVMAYTTLTVARNTNVELFNAGLIDLDEMKRNRARSDLIFERLIQAERMRDISKLEFATELLAEYVRALNERKLD